MTTSWTALEVPFAPTPLETIKDDIKAEPPIPANIPTAGTLGASDIRAAKFGLYAVALRKWGRGLVAAIDKREAAAAALAARQTADRRAALARLKALREAEK